MIKYWTRAAGLCLVMAGAANAATVTVSVSDSSGRPAADAIVALSPAGDARVASRTPDKAVIRQKDETFIPLVVIVRRGGEVTFTNNDTTMHQVYSFSPIRQFAFEVEKGQVSKPVVFDKPGVAAIGCNIHDQMIAYVYVADAPLVEVTDGAGRAAWRDVPPGAYRVTVWHPRLPPGRSWPEQALSVADGPQSLSFSLPLLVAADRGMKHMHMGY